MSFRFRFLAILELRRRERDEAGANLGKANEAIRRVDQQLTQIQSERQQMRQLQQGQRLGNVSVDHLLGAGRYDLQLQADIAALQKTRGDLVTEQRRRQAVLTAAEAEVKRFERLQEKEQQHYQAELLRREQAEADEQVTRRYALDRLRARS